MADAQSRAEGDEHEHHGQNEKNFSAGTTWAFIAKAVPDREKEKS
jgi:hypothetical protein